MEPSSPVSVPLYVPRPPRTLTSEERRGLVAVADALIGDGSAGPRPSTVEGYVVWLDRALAARRDAFETITALAVRLAAASAADLPAQLKHLSEDAPDDFQALSTVVAGAYLMMPVIRQNIGYPGQASRPPRFDEAAEQIMGGILEPVIARGPVYRWVDVDVADACAGDPSR